MGRFTTLIAISAVLLLAAMAACSSGGGSDENNEYISSPNIENTSTVETPATETVVAEPEATPNELYLEVTSPSNETIVTSQEVQVTGTTLPTAIVSINGELTSVDSKGSFTTATTLDAGANLIEVVSSNLAGEEIGEVLTIVYLGT